MKQIMYLLIPLGLAVTPAPGGEDKPVFRDAATHEDLVEKTRAAGRVDKLGDVKPVRKEDPSVTNRPKSILETSDVLSFNGFTTLVPKGSIIGVSEAYEGRVNPSDPHNNLVRWKEFYARNRGWITTVEVSRDQAHGEKPLEEELAKQLEESADLIVATLKGSPISMLPLKPDAQQKNEETSDPS